MKRVMVRYKVKADRAEENASYIRRVFQEPARTPPSGLHYASFKLEDGVSFVHISSSESERNPLLDLPVFKEFVAGIRERCEEPPVTVELTEIGAYRVFGA